MHIDTNIHGNGLNECFSIKAKGFKTLNTHPHTNASLLNTNINVIDFSLTLSHFCLIFFCHRCFGNSLFSILRQVWCWRISCIFIHFLFGFHLSVTTKCDLNNKKKTHRPEACEVFLPNTFLFYIFRFPIFFIHHFIFMIFFASVFCEVASSYLYDTRTSTCVCVSMVFYMGKGKCFSVENSNQ